MVVLLITFVVLLVIGMPVAFVIGLAGVAFFASAPEIPFSIAVQRIVAADAVVHCFWPGSVFHFCGQS